MQNQAETTTPVSTLDPGFLEECEREALHHIGAIQPYGALLGGRLGDATVRAVSADLDAWLGRPAASLLGRALWPLLADWLGRYFLLPAPLAAAVAVELRPEPCGIARGSGWRPRLASYPAHRDAPIVVLLQSDALRPVPHALYRMPHSPKEWDAHCSLLAAQMQRVSGFDRVMVYRFLPDACGEVIAEAAQPGLAPYLGLRYPASDIPQVARALYLANRHRQIPTVSPNPVPVLAMPDFTPDLTLSDLRAVSPVHIDYLRNMEVTASLSFSVVLNGALWGLIACHHHAPRHLPLQLRERCADLVQVFSLGIAGYQTAQAAGAADRDRRLSSRLAAGIAAFETGALAALDDMLARVPDALPLHVAKGRLHARMKQPAAAVEALKTAVALAPDEVRPRVLLAQALMRVEQPDAAAAAYREALRLEPKHHGAQLGLARLQLQRRQYDDARAPQTVYWAGDPRKSTLFDGQSNMRSPRSSFAAWLETKTGHAEPWSDTVLLSAKKFRSLLLRQMNADLLRLRPPTLPAGHRGLHRPCPHVGAAGHPERRGVRRHRRRACAGARAHRGRDLCVVRSPRRRAYEH